MNYKMTLEQIKTAVDEGKTHCSKCFLGKTGWRLKEYVNTSMDTL